MKYTMRCEECKHWVHYLCTALPIYILLCLASTNRRFTCEKCSFEKYGDDEWVIEASDAIKRQKNKTRTQTPLPQNTAGSLAQQQQPRESTPETESTQTADVSDLGENPTQINVDLGNTPEDIDFNQIPSTPERGTGEPTHTRNNPSTTTITTSTQQGGPRHSQTDRQREDLPNNQRPRNTYHTNTRGHHQTHTYHSGGNNGNPLPPRVCKQYRQGRCNYGPNCQFSHPPLCKYFMIGGLGRDGCQRERCKYLHPSICPRSWHKGECLYNTCNRHHLKGTKRLKPHSNQKQDTNRNSTPPPAPQIQHATKQIEDVGFQQMREKVMELQNTMHQLMGMVKPQVDMPRPPIPWIKHPQMYTIYQ